MKVDVRMACQPLVMLWLVGAQIVEDDMEFVAFIGLGCESRAADVCLAPNRTEMT